LVARGVVVYAETMLDPNAAFETNAGKSNAQPVRDRLPTIPHDLSEYARTETGPSSWSAAPASASALEDEAQTSVGVPHAIVRGPRRSKLDELIEKLARGAWSSVIEARGLVGTAVALRGRASALLESSQAAPGASGR
jgi:hypothetical protein